MWSTHLPLDDVPFRDLMSERLGLPVLRRQRRERWRCSPSSAFGAAAGAPDALLLTLGTGIGGAVFLAGGCTAGRTESAGELGHVVVDMDGPPCQGKCPNRGCLEVMASGIGDRARGRRRRPSAHPASPLGRVRAQARAVTGALVTELAHDGDPIARWCSRWWAAARCRAGVAGERLRPRGDRDRRWRDRRRRDAARARARGDRGPGAAAARVTKCGSCARTSARRRGCSVPRCWRCGRAGRCEPALAAGRLPDADRQPRGHHAARAGGAARGRRDRRRGHASHARRCSIATGCRAPLVSYHEHNEARRAAELVARMQAGEVVALVSDAGMPLVSDPGYVLVRACVAAGLAVEVLPGPSAALTALVASGLPSDAWRFVGFLPRKKRRAAARCSPLPRPATLVAFESPRRVPASLAVLAALDPERAGGGLPRADEAARGGRARDGCGAGGALRGRAAARGGGAGGRAGGARRLPRGPLGRGARRGQAAGRGGREAAARGRAWWPS